MAIHEFDTTGEAYDDCQTCLENGETLVIASEQVVGISCTWPIAVTVQTGDLHSASPNASIPRLLENAGITAEHVRVAAQEALTRGFKVAPWAELLAHTTHS